MFFFKFNFLWMLVVTALAIKTIQPIRLEGPGAKKAIGWAVQKTSTIKILGATNINNFGCDMANYSKADTIYFSRENNSKPVMLSGILEVDISKFDCHNKMLTHDLRETLKADEFPKLVIRFLSLERTPAIHNNKDFLKGWVEIELAGNKRKFELNYSFVATGNSLIQLNGNRCFSFRDFNLVPPKKFAGLIKVKDRFDVDFNLLLEPVE